jgi:acetoacetate decarboxylase
MRATVGCGLACAEHLRAEIAARSYMLKVMRGDDGRPRICELVRTQITNLTTWLSSGLVTASHNSTVIVHVA